MQIVGPHLSVMRSRMMFRELIRTVQNTLLPIDMELALPDTIANPIKRHVHGFGPFLFYSVVGDTTCRAVVHDNWCWWLKKMTQFLQDVADRICFLAIVE